MKLFTPTQAKQEFKAKQSVDIISIAYLETTLRSLQEQINRENDNFTKRLEEQRKVYGDEKIALRAYLAQLGASVKLLKEQRKALMIPVDTLKKEAEEMHKEAEARLKDIDFKENEINGKIEVLTAKLDELSERELNISKKESEIESKRKGIEEESQQVSDGHKRLNELMTSFNAEVTSKTNELSIKEKALEIEKQRMAEYLESRTKELNEQERGLADRRAALERAIKLSKVNI